MRYVCQFCGYRGDDPSEDSLDRIQCELCGEPAAERAD
jgi:DNA-directed RNA polymerase subunit RPC12/RpoP